MGRIYTVLMTLFFLLLGLISTSCALPEPEPKPVISEVKFFIGSVTLNGGQVAVGEHVKTGDLIVTDSKSSCELFLDGSIIKIKENTSVRLTSTPATAEQNEIVIDLDKGKTICKPRKLLDRETFIVRTPAALAAVRGTIFSIRSDKNQNSEIKVFEGSVRAAPHIRALDDNPQSYYTIGTTIPAQKACVVSKKDAETANMAIEAALDKGMGPEEAVKANSNKLKIPKASIYTLTDAKLEDTPLIDITPNVNENALKKIIKKKPKAYTQLFISEHMIYLVKNGKVTWKGDYVSEPFKKNNRIYAASKSNIICANASSGKLVWIKKVSSTGEMFEEEKRIVLVTLKGIRYFSFTDGTEIFEKL